MWIYIYIYIYIYTAHYNMYWPVLLTLLYVMSNRVRVQVLSQNSFKLYHFLLANSVGKHIKNKTIRQKKMKLCVSLLYNSDYLLVREIILVSSIIIIFVTNN